MSQTNRHFLDRVFRAASGHEHRDPVGTIGEGDAGMVLTAGLVRRLAENLILAHEQIATLRDDNQRLQLDNDTYADALDRQSDDHVQAMSSIIKSHTGVLLEAMGAKRVAIDAGAISDYPDSRVIVEDGVANTIIYRLRKG